MRDRSLKSIATPQRRTAPQNEQPINARELGSAAGKHQGVGQHEVHGHGVESRPGDFPDDGDADQRARLNHWIFDVATQLLRQMRFEIGAAHAGKRDLADVRQAQRRSGHHGERVRERGVPFDMEEDAVARLKGGDRCLRPTPPSRGNKNDSDG